MDVFDALAAPSSRVHSKQVPQLVLIHREQKLDLAYPEALVAERLPLKVHCFQKLANALIHEQLHTFD